MRRLLLLALLVGCSGKTVVTTDASADPWLVDAADLDVLDAGRCAVETIGTCASGPAEVMFTARAGSRVVSVAPPAIVLAPLEVAFVGDPRTYAPRDPEDVPLQGVAAAFTPDLAMSVHLLGCDTKRCRVFGVDRKDPPGLVRLGGELPATTRAIAYVDRRLWIAGDGVRTLEGTDWSVGIEGGHFQAISGDTLTDGTTVVAVGDDGLVAIRAHDVWSTTHLPTSDRLVAVAVAGFDITIASETGALFFGTRSGFVACTGPSLGARSIDVSRMPGARRWFGATNDGATFELDAAGAACRGEPLPGQLGAREYWCGISQNVWRFTASTVIGSNGCARD